MKTSTRRTGAHRAVPTALAREAVVSHQRGSVRRERQYVQGLRQTPSAPWWSAERPPVTAGDHDQEADTMIIKRVVETGKHVLTVVENRRRISFKRSVNHPDRWYWTSLAVSILMGLMIGVFGILPTYQYLPDMPYGSYNTIVQSGGISDYELMYPLGGHRD